MVVNDLTFEHDSDPSEVATLWGYATPSFLITARKHPLKTCDDLRAAVRAGLRVASGIDLLAKLFGLRMEALHDLVDDINGEVDEIEDQVLRGRVTEQREQLGRLRRDCARLRRGFAPERTAMQKMVARPQTALGDQVSDWLRSVADDLAFLTDEVLALQERAKLLQEELSARVAEDTGRKLNALTALTAAFLPMTLITGIFGMNVAGLPGTDASRAFGWVMLLILAAGAVALGSTLLQEAFLGLSRAVLRSRCQGFGNCGEDALGERIRVRAGIPAAEEGGEIAAPDLALEKPGKCIDHVGIGWISVEIVLFPIG